nr:hypothetical protein [Tanacetum cinerariifolium]
MALGGPRQRPRRRGDRSNSWRAIPVRDKEQDSKRAYLCSLLLHQAWKCKDNCEPYLAGDKKRKVFESVVWKLINDNTPPSSQGKRSDMRRAFKAFSSGTVAVDDLAGVDLHSLSFFEPFGTKSPLTTNQQTSSGWVLPVCGYLRKLRFDPPPAGRHLPHPDHKERFTMMGASSDHHGMTLTNTLFNGSNFHGWNRNVKMALDAKLKLGFIDGSCLKPDIEDDDFLQVNYGKKLQKDMDKNNNGLSTCDCGKIRECTCDVLGKFMLRDSNSKLIQFLMKLNDEYESVKNQILAMDPLPTVNKAYYIVQQIEKQKQVTNHTFEPSAFFANLNNKRSNSGRKENRGSRNDGKRFCICCNQEGHTVDQCFKKIGYLDWYKGKKSKKQGRVAANVTVGFDDHFSGDTPFDLGSENEIGVHQWGSFDQKLVAVVCQEVMRMFKGK